MWIPKADDLSMNASFGNLATYFSLNLKRFKRDFEITGYVDPNMTLEQIAEHYNIEENEIKKYLTPYIVFSGWMTLLTSKKFFRSLFSTVYIVSVSLVVGGLLSISTGSVLARFRKRWHVVVYNSYLLQIIIPPIMVIIPVYLILTHYMGLRNSYLSLILLYIKGGAVSTMVFTGYFASLPQELKESVFMDGGGQVRYFRSIILPLSSTPFASYIVVHLPVFWNNLIYGFVFLKPEKQPIVPLITSLSSEYATNFQAIYSALFISVLPMLALYLLFQKMFIRSALAGAVKE
jgi:multiple sugar transport system permease protein